MKTKFMFKRTLFTILFWALSCSWGLIMTLIGFITLIVCKVFLKGTIHKNGCSIITEVGGNWGGVSLGAFTFCGKYCTGSEEIKNIQFFESTRRHEFGHSIQNCLFGPLFIFLIAIPSAIRYQKAMSLQRKGEYVSDEWYESFWGESLATKWGTEVIDFFYY